MADPSPDMPSVHQVQTSEPQNLPYPGNHILAAEKPFLIKTFSVSSTQPSGTAIVYTSPLTTLINASRTYTVPYVKLRYRAIEISIIPQNAAISNAGMMRVAFTKTYEVMNRGSPPGLYDLYRASTVDNFTVPFSFAQPVTFQIPFVHNLTLFDIRRRDILDNIPSGVYIGVDQKLTNTTGVACTVSFAMYARFVDAEWHQQVITSTTPASSIDVSLPSNTSWALQTVGAFGATREAKEKSEKGVVSGVASTIKRASDILSPIDPTGITGVISSVASAVGAVADMFGLDKPTALDFASFAALRLGDHLLGTTGLDPSLVWNITPESRDDVDASIFNDTYDVLNIQSMASQYSIISSGVAPVLNSGDIFASLRVTPSLKNLSGGKYVVTNAALATTPFNYWAGDMRYRLTIAEDQFFSANVFICLFPDDVDPLPTNITIPQLNTLRYTLVKASQCTVIEFTIPYDQFAQWSTTNTIVDAQAMAIGFGVLDTPKRSGVNTGFSYTLEVAASNVPGRFKVAVPNNWAPPAALGYLADGVPTPLPAAKTAVVPIETFRDLFRRYEICNPVDNSVVSPAIISPDLQAGTLARTILTAFVGFRGSLRYTLYLPPASILHLKAYPPGGSVQGTFPSNGSIAGSVLKYEDYNPENSNEFPYLSPRSFELISRTASVQPYGYYAATLKPPGAADLYVALADDYTVGIRTFTPSLT